MMRPLPRTGPSRRCRLQLTTQTRLSSLSRAASVSALMLSGSSISPSPNTPQTLRAGAVQQLAVGEVAHEARVVDRADRADAHRAGRELPEVGHQPRVRVAATGRCAPAAGARELLAVVRQVALAAGGLRGRRARRRPARCAAGRTPGRRRVPSLRGAEEWLKPTSNSRPRWRSWRCGRPARHRPGWRAPPSPARSSASATPAAPRSPGRRGRPAAVDRDGVDVGRAALGLPGRRCGSRAGRASSSRM